MKQRQRALVVASLCATCACIGLAAGQTPAASSEMPRGAASAQLGEARIFAGVRLWANQWDIVGLERRAVIPSPGSPPVLQDVLVKSLSKLEFVPIAVVGMSVGNLQASASYFVRSGYDSRDPLLGTVRRDEFDVTLGYAILPSLVLSAGYKRATQSRLSGQFSPSDAKVDGFLLGASASAPLAGRLFLYGNVAYGFAKEKTAFEDAAGNSSYSASYKIGEVGLSYLAYEQAEGRGLKSVLVSFGYRAQNFTTKSVELGTFSLAATPTVLATQNRDANTTTDGFVLGIVGSF